MRLIICCRVSKNTLMPPASCPISSLFFKEILRVRSPLPDSISFKISFSCVVTLLTGFTTVRTDPITATTKNTSTSTNVTPLTARELLYTDSCSATPASTFASIYPSSSVSTPSTFSLVGASTVLQICLALSLFPREIKSAIRYRPRCNRQTFPEVSPLPQLPPASVSAPHRNRSMSECPCGTDPPAPSADPARPWMWTRTSGM